MIEIKYDKGIKKYIIKIGNIFCCLTDKELIKSLKKVKKLINHRLKS